MSANAFPNIKLNGGKVFNAGWTQGGPSAGLGRGIDCQSVTTRLEIHGTRVQDCRGTGIHVEAFNPYYVATGITFEGNGANYNQYGKPKTFMTGSGIVTHAETQQTFGSNVVFELNGYTGGGEGPEIRLSAASGI